MNWAQHLVELIVGYRIDWESTAAWVQALGAILALAVAIELPRRAKRATLRTFRQTVLAYCTAINQGVRAVATLDGTLNEVADKTTVTSVSLEVNLPSLIGALEQMPLVNLEDDKAVNAAIRLAGAARAFLNTPVASSLTIEEATQILVNGRTPRSHAVDQVALRYAELLARIAPSQAAR